jgi:hypothetical protein
MVSVRIGLALTSYIVPRPPALPRRRLRRAHPAQTGSPHARRGTGGTTLNDVAALAGVSAITVSRALKKPDVVAQETLAQFRTPLPAPATCPT